MKRRVAGLLATACILLGGCAPGGLARPADEGAGGWCYRRLSSEQKAAYIAVCDAVEASFAEDQTVTVGDSAYFGVTARWSPPLSSVEDVKTVYAAALSDHPDYFFWHTVYRYDRTEDGIASLTLTYTMDAARRQTCRRELAAAVRETLAGLPAGADAFWRELYCHDALARRCTYGNEAACGAEDAFSPALTAYGALVEGRAVCEGYARAFQLLLQEAGIDGTTVEGEAQGEAHIWNLVEIDGEPYEVDVTWDDDERGLLHTYFNLTSADMGKSRVSRGTAVGAAPATATAANYHRRLGRTVDSPDRAALLSAATAAAAGGETAVSLRCAKGVYRLQKGRLQFDGKRILADVCRALPTPRQTTSGAIVVDDALCTVTLLLTVDGEAIKKSGGGLIFA